jgi:hypothetical protein
MKLWRSLYCASVQNGNEILMAERSEVCPPKCRRARLFRTTMCQPHILYVAAPDDIMYEGSDENVMNSCRSLVASNIHTEVAAEGSKRPSRRLRGVSDETVRILPICSLTHLDMTK